MKRSVPVLFSCAVFGLLAPVSWNRWIEPNGDPGFFIEICVPAKGPGGTTRPVP